MRLDRMLANMGYGTRSEVKKLLKSGEVTVNGEVVKSPVSIDENNDQVMVYGEPVVYEKYVYFMLHKPQGVISATRGNEPTVLDLLDEPFADLYPVGRLDKDTTGLLLITNDGPLGHALLSPKRHVEKEYVVTLRDEADLSYVSRLGEGIMIDGGEVCQPAEFAITEDPHVCHIILREGRYHEIKRMMEALGNEVIALKRIRMKNLILDEMLLEGEYRPLTEEEVDDLRTALN